MTNKKAIDRIPIHWLHNQAFCEYQIYLEWVKDIQDPNPSRDDLADGRIAHDILTAEHNEQAIPTDKNVFELTHEAQDTKSTYTLRNFLVIGTRMVGSIDEIQFTPICVNIIEDKPRHQRDPFISETRQAQGYAIAFKETYPVTLPLKVVIRDRDTSKWIWDKILDGNDIKGVNEAVDRITGILDGSWKPEPTRNANKCRACRWNMVCDQNAFTMLTRGIT